MTNETKEKKEMMTPANSAPTHQDEAAPDKTYGVQLLYNETTGEFQFLTREAGYSRLTIYGMLEMAKETMLKAATSEAGQAKITVPKRGLFGMGGKH